MSTKKRTLEEDETEIVVVKEERRDVASLSWPELSKLMLDPKFIDDLPTDADFWFTLLLKRGFLNTPALLELLEKWRPVDLTLHQALRQSAIKSSEIIRADRWSNPKQLDHIFASSEEEPSLISLYRQHSAALQKSHHDPITRKLISDFLERTRSQVKILQTQESSNRLLSSIEKYLKYKIDLKTPATVSFGFTKKLLKAFNNEKLSLFLALVETLTSTDFDKIQSIFYGSSFGRHNIDLEGWKFQLKYFKHYLREGDTICVEASKMPQIPKHYALLSLDKNDYELIEIKVVSGDFLYPLVFQNFIRRLKPQSWLAFRHYFTILDANLEPRIYRLSYSTNGGAQEKDFGDDWKVWVTEYRVEQNIKLIEINRESSTVS